MNWFILSLIAILFWSGSDLFSKMGSKPDDKYSHWKMVMAVGLVMGTHAIILIATGTPAGVGMGFDPPRFLQSGDTVECAIEGIGTLCSTVI